MFLPRSASSATNSGGQRDAGVVCNNGRTHGLNRVRRGRRRIDLTHTLNWRLNIRKTMLSVKILMKLPLSTGIKNSKRTSFDDRLALSEGPLIGQLYLPKTASITSMLRQKSRSE